LGEDGTRVALTDDRFQKSESIVQRDENGIATMRNKARATRGASMICAGLVSARKGKERGEGGEGEGQDLLNLPKD
jgi:hypothetical protein